MLRLLPVLVATAIGPALPPAPSLTPYDLATLTDDEARQLAGRRAVRRVTLARLVAAEVDGERLTDAVVPWAIRTRLGSIFAGDPSRG